MQHLIYVLLKVDIEATTNNEYNYVLKESNTIVRKATVNNESNDTFGKAGEECDLIRDVKDFILTNSLKIPLRKQNLM